MSTITPVTNDHGLSDRQQNILHKLYVRTGSKDRAYRLAQEDYTDVFSGVSRERVRNYLTSVTAEELDTFTLPRMLYLDIETSLIKGTLWRTGQQYVSMDNIDQDWNLLSWAGCWLDAPSDIKGQSLLDFKDTRKDKEVPWFRDDSDLALSVWLLLDYADIVIGHNLDRFDCRKLNTRFAAHGLPPTSPYQTVDTLKVARKNFAFTSNKLKDIAEFFGVTAKLDPGGYATWTKCLVGDEESFENMLHYNKGDIVTGYQVYMCMRPWCKPHPHVALDSDEDRCATCGSLNLEQTTTFVQTGAARYIAWRCKDCGAITRNKKSAKLGSSLRSSNK